MGNTGKAALALAILTGNLAGGEAAHAQPYPSRPVRVLVGFAAGGAADAAARLMAQRLTSSLGQPVVAENRTGAGGSLASEAVARAAPDGYVLLMMAAADAIQPAVRLRMPYELPRDFTPVSLVATGPFVLVVHPSVPAKSVRELLAIARGRPGQLNYATSGTGSSAHLASELLDSLGRVKTTQVPYKGSSQGLLGVALGEAEMAFAVPTAAQPLIEAGRLRALAVSTAKRSALLPHLPTLHESGVPGFDRTGWYGLAGPAGLPKDVVAKLHDAVVAGVNSPDLKAAFLRQGLEVGSNSPEQFTEMIRRDVAQNVRLARDAGIRQE